MQNQKLKINKNSKHIFHSESHSNEEQQFEESKRMNSSLLPKIHKTTAITKLKTNHDHNNGYTTKMVIDEVQQLEKRKKMAHIISDYLENFRLKQKGSLLVVASQKNKLEHKPIRVQGISHNKFVVGRQHTSLENIQCSSEKKLCRLRANRSFIQKIRKDCKVESFKLRERKIHTQASKDLKQQPSLKGYVLKAKKSIIDCKQKSRQKVGISKKISQIGPW